eukprot:TRINITY_DN7045_c0_g1_i1.p1 TRINITY_DN7045_c0_g1~~TRINITY_DN7045_c0_g1_i1.p1  ORF type:complete len:397 (+),score=20.82 TRINITY_DN7045_c0_g1_i1:29-1219(+)
MADSEDDGDKPISLVVYQPTGTPFHSSAAYRISETDNFRQPSCSNRVLQKSDTTSLSPGLIFRYAANSPQIEHPGLRATFSEHLRPWTRVHAQTTEPSLDQFVSDLAPVSARGDRTQDSLPRSGPIVEALPPLVSSNELPRSQDQAPSITKPGDLRINNTALPLPQRVGHVGIASIGEDSALDGTSSSIDLNRQNECCQPSLRSTPNEQEKQGTAQTDSVPDTFDNTRYTTPARGADQSSFNPQQALATPAPHADKQLTTAQSVRQQTAWLVARSEETPRVKQLHQDRSSFTRGRWIIPMTERQALENLWLSLRQRLYPLKKFQCTIHLRLGSGIAPAHTCLLGNRKAESCMCDRVDGIHIYCDLQDAETVGQLLRNTYYIATPLRFYVPGQGHIE